MGRETRHRDEWKSEGPLRLLTATCRAMKRTLDFTAATGALSLLSPLMIGIAIAIKLDSTGPVLFRQERLGLYGSTFEIFKFRTMREGSPVIIQDDLSVANPPVDDRVTRVGRHLRATSLDELPQLLNVLLGQMSLVGPRPDLPPARGLYSPRERRKLSVKPGITGLAQVSGRNDLDVHARWELDAAYADSSAPWLDAVILLKTVLAVVRREGIYR